MHDRIDGPFTGDVIISPTAGVVYILRHRRGRFNGGVHVTKGAVTCRGGGWGGSGWLGMRSSALLEDAERGSSRKAISNVVLYLIQSGFWIWIRTMIRTLWNRGSVPPLKS